MAHAILVSNSNLFDQNIVSKLNRIGCHATRFDDLGEYEHEEKYFFILDLDSFSLTYLELENFLFEYGLPAIAMSSIPRYDQGVQLMKIGLKGYMSPYTSAENTQHAIRSVLEGAMWFDPGVIQEIIAHLSVPETPVKPEPASFGLSDREIQTVHYLSKGISNKEIAELLDITERTVKAHIQSCYQKLGIHDRVSLALWGKRMLNV